MFSRPRYTLRAEESRARHADDRASERGEVASGLAGEGSREDPETPTTH